jgi:hypothetical protein
MFKIKVTDKVFRDSPDAGTKECTCSRCSNVIQENESPLRMFSILDNTEYRFCDQCQRKAGVWI